MPSIAMRHRLRLMLAPVEGVVESESVSLDDAGCLVDSLLTGTELEDGLGTGVLWKLLVATGCGWDGGGGGCELFDFGGETIECDCDCECDAWLLGLVNFGGNVGGANFVLETDDGEGEEADGDGDGDDDETFAAVVVDGTDACVDVAELPRVLIALSNTSVHCRAGSLGSVQSTMNSYNLPSLHVRLRRAPRSDPWPSFAWTTLTIDVVGMVPRACNGC